MYSILSRCKSVLLLGEANFSFSLSLRKLLPPTVAMVTSCLQSEEKISDDGAMENVDALKEMGAEVCFSLDATKLDQCPSLEGAVFDAVVFNFPHVGGKGNIGRNRELLKQFFVCCRGLLAPEGRVLVTLCNGQGGTPADQPQRKWSDSWQVVAMATYGSFILTETLPFSSDGFPDYQCTGYRSQSKRFVTRGAVTHVFEQSLPTIPSAIAPDKYCHLVLPSSTEPAQHTWVRCPKDLQNAMERDLLSKENHPLHQASRDLHQLLQTHLPGCSLYRSEGLPLVLEAEDVISLEEMSRSSLYELDVVEQIQPALGDGRGNADMCRQHEEGCPPEASARGAKAVEGSAKLCQGTRLPDPDWDGSSEPALPTGNESGMAIKTLFVCRSPPSRARSSPAKFVLRPNLLGRVPEMISGNPSSPRMTFAKVFHRCEITLTRYPIMHQCLVAFPSSSQIDDASCEDRTERICQSLSTLLSLEVAIVSKDLTNSHNDNITEKASLLIKMEEPNQLCNGIVNIGHVGLYHLPEGDVTYCLLNLDQIAMIRYGVQDIRLFWSEDERIFDKFASVYKDKNSHNPGNDSRLQSNIQFLPYSVHPPTYTHDISFWLPADTFDELTFCSVIRSVTFDLVREVRFLNQYINRKTSYTYRLVYQSCDAPLTKQAATQLQLDVRSAIDKWLGLEPR